MNGKVSFNKFLRNDKLMIICSIILGLIIWYSVVYGPSVTEDKSISVPINVRLNSSAENGENLPGQYYRVLSRTQETVEVIVSGNRSVLSKLKAEDIVVSADMSDVLEAVDDYTLELKASKNTASSITDYKIEELKTQQIKVTCDYVGETNYTVEKDITSVKVTDETKYQLGTPVLDSQYFPGDSVTVSGPKKVRDRIVKIVARVNSNKTVKKSTVFEAKLVAYDSKGKQVDLSQCTFPKLADQEDPTLAQMTVPVNYFAKVNLGIKATNIPEAYKNQDGFMTLNPPTLDLLGQEEEVTKLAEELKEIPLNFDNVPLTNQEITIPLNIPSHVTVADSTKSVKVKINMSDFSSRKLSVPLFNSDGKTLASNVTVHNRPDNTSMTVTTKTLSVTVIGKKSDVSALKAADLTVTIDMKKAAAAGGLNTYPARVTIAGKKTVWVYYGGDAKDSYEVYINTKTS